jgi:radical SAM superfamily enzyme YgiQ (UPF0313 family)
LSRPKRDKTSGKSSSASKSRQDLLALESGTYLKKWTGRLPVALIYPNSYHVGMSSLGYQLVYRILNDYEHIVCERLFLPETGGQPLSIESGRTANDFKILFCSISFEQDYVNLARFFLASGLAPLAADRPDRISEGSPLVVCGGVATFMNPEPLAPFADLFLIGEAEQLLPDLVAELQEKQFRDRSALLRKLSTSQVGFYAPYFYEPVYNKLGIIEKMRPEPGLPARIEKAFLGTAPVAPHSELVTSATEFDDLYLTELGRGCSRGCRFCAAGFVYRPHRLWEESAILDGLQERPEKTERVGLVGMEMTSRKSLQSITGRIQQDGCTLSFSSLRADRISDELLELLSRSKLKSVAIAPDGASERLRRVINKGLDEADLLRAAGRLAESGLFRLKLYLMIGLPTETEADLYEFLELVEKILAVMKPIGQRRGRLCELTVSVNSFVPKPWTPFQYHPFSVSEKRADGSVVSAGAAVKDLRGKIKILKKGLAALPNTRASFDNPDHALFQAVLARGDRRLAPVLLNMAASGISWKQAMKQGGINPELYATRQLELGSWFPWNIIDHSIHESYLWSEYCKSMDAKTTSPCDTTLCRKCGVCND